MKRVLLGLTIAAFAIALVPSTSSAAIYEGFVGCDDSTETPLPSHKCLTTDFTAAYFEASVETDYEICLYHLDDPEECSDPSLAEADTLVQNSIGKIDVAGTYEAVWWAAGTEEELAEWEFTIESPPAPPAPPVVLPVVPPVVIPILPSTTSTKCIEAQRRVTRLKGKVKKAHGEQKAKLKAKLKKARGAANSAC